jgi:hypothetical protein
VPYRPLRPLVVVALLALGDYLLWNWSLGANHDIVALVCGMTLIPLLIALAWLFVVAVTRLIAHTARRPRAGVVRAGREPRLYGRRAGTAGAPASGEEPRATFGGDPATAAAGRPPTTASPSSKLAA